MINLLGRERVRNRESAISVAWQDQGYSSYISNRRNNIKTTQANDTIKFKSLNDRMARIVHEIHALCPMDRSSEYKSSGISS